MSEGARAVMLLLKLDIISCLNYAWREAHNKMLLRCSIALDCLRRTLPPIDDDQKLALLHAPFKELFGGELAKLQEANMKRAGTFTMFPQPTVPPASYSTQPYVRRGRSFNDRKGFKKPGGRGRGKGRATPSASSTNPGQSKEGQKTLTVSVSSDSKKHKVEPRDEAPQPPPPGKPRLDFMGTRTKVINNESTPSPSKSLGGQISPGSRRNFGPAGTNHPHAPKERDNRGAFEFTRVLFERIPGTKSFRRVASSYRSKESERPHSCTSFPYVHDKLCSKLRSKRRLCV